ncbi:MAG TPA: PAS domain S-box protein, partial [Victivallales bacterium]|nr:PAS domain S-box protein [Victivallales bacterium]
YPSYFEAILQDKLISADNAHSDPGTTELLESYLIPNGISSMMDTLISLGKEPFGILCCEHSGEPRNWTIEETNYQMFMANLVSLYFQTAKAENTEKILEGQISRFQSLTTQSDVGLIVMDQDNKVIYVNPETEALFGEKIKSILGSKCPNELFDEKNQKKIQIITKNGEKGVALVTCRECDWEGKKSKLLTVKDISATK